MSSEFPKLHAKFDVILSEFEKVLESKIESGDIEEVELQISEANFTSRLSKTKVTEVLGEIGSENPQVAFISPASNGQDSIKESDIFAFSQVWARINDDTVRAFISEGPRYEGEKFIEISLRYEGKNIKCTNQYISNGPPDVERGSVVYSSCNPI